MARKPVANQEELLVNLVTIRVSDDTLNGWKNYCLRAAAGA